MSKYEPQKGDRVRRTYPDGTIIEGVIARDARTAIKVIKEYTNE